VVLARGGKEGKGAYLKKDNQEPTATKDKETVQKVNAAFSPSPGG
jgi:hypothetical protein